MGFRVLYLPHVVLRELFHSMDLGDLTCLALTSRRSYQLVKFFRRKYLELYISHLTDNPFSHKILVSIRFQGVQLLALNVYRHPRKEQIVEVHGRMVTLSRTLDGLSFNFFGDSVLGLMSLVDFAQDLFSLKIITGVEVDQKSFWVLKWVDRRQRSLPEAKIYSDYSELTAEEYGNELSNNSADNLLLYATPPSQFQFKGQFKPRELCEITEGDWITVDDLIAMNSAVIMISYSELTSVDINQFLIAWTNGAIPRTRWFHVSTIEFNFEEALIGLEVKKLAESRVVKEKFDCHRFLKFTSTHEIKQANGVKAFIGYRSPQFYFSTSL